MVWGYSNRHYVLNWMGILYTMPKKATTAKKKATTVKKRKTGEKDDDGDAKMEE